MATRLNKAQFGQLANTLNEGAGFSVKTRNNANGSMAFARSSYMAAGLSGAPEGTIPQPSTGSDIKAYADEHRSKLEPTDRYLGGWGGTLDVATAYPRTEEGMLDAVYHGILGGQDAVGEVDDDAGYVRDIPTQSGMAATPYTVDKKGKPIRDEWGGRSIDESLVYRTPENRALRKERPPG